MNLIRTWLCRQYQLRQRHGMTVDISGIAGTTMSYEMIISHHMARDTMGLSASPSQKLLSVLSS
eukprot:jgi/Botrbrau1/18229/Bobra.53_1s0085.3